jgi:hypothetical protein
MAPSTQTLTASAAPASSTAQSRARASSTAQSRGARACAQSPASPPSYSEFIRHRSYYQKHRSFYRQPENTYGYIGMLHIAVDYDYQRHRSYYPQPENTCYYNGTLHIAVDYETRLMNIVDETEGHGQLEDWAQAEGKMEPAALVQAEGVDNSVKRVIILLATSIFLGESTATAEPAAEDYMTNRASAQAERASAQAERISAQAERISALQDAHGRPDCYAECNSPTTRSPIPERASTQAELSHAQAERASAQAERISALQDAHGRPNCYAECDDRGRHSCCDAHGRPGCYANDGLGRRATPTPFAHFG